jgi:hypothetical protein
VLLYAQVAATTEDHSCTQKQSGLDSNRTNVQPCHFCRTPIQTRRSRYTFDNSVRPYQTLTGLPGLLLAFEKLFTEKRKRQGFRIIRREISFENTDMVSVIYVAWKRIPYETPMPKHRSSRLRVKFHTRNFAAPSGPQLAGSKINDSEHQYAYIATAKVMSVAIPGQYIPIESGLCHQIKSGSMV